MESMPFYRLGLLVSRFRILIIILWALIVLCCVPFLPNIIAPFQSTGFIAENSNSAKTDRYLDKKLGSSSNQLLIIYHSNNLSATSASFKNKLEQSLSQLKKYPLKHEIIYPSMNKKQISRDKHTAYTVLIFKDKKKLTADQLQEIKSLIKKPSNMTMELGGESVFLESLNVQTQKDLSKADIIAAPIAIITLVLVFGSIVAATLPVILGGSCAVLILMTLYLIAHACSLSIFTLNIALLLGLCLSLDYSLFIVSRFREELEEKKTLAEAIGMTMATAGKSVFFSGLAVFISLSALLMFPVNILFSVGIGGLTAVFVAVIIAIIVLPAVLTVVNTGINRLPVRLFKSTKPNKSPLWHWIALNVVKRPLLYFIGALLFLLLLGAPFLNANIGVSDVHILPEHSQSRMFFDQFGKSFETNKLTPIRLAITTENSSILSSKNISKVYDLSKSIKENPLVSDVTSITSSEPSLTKQQYQMLYKSSKRYDDPDIRALLSTTTNQNLTTINVVSKHQENSPQTTKLIAQLRDMNPGNGLEMQVTGLFVNNQDVLKSISKVFPYAVVWILVLTYLILLLLLRSVFLPLKAILMNALSLCASYGVLVFIFQEGHLHQLLNFSPQGLVDISLMVIIFCALFGFSMDYEVFLLTRIQESYVKNNNNNQSIVFGIEHSSRIITSAALIVIVTCASFMVAEVLMVKEFGLGIAVAIAVDAFIVRSLLVPATMSLVKQWNWYLPTWLDRILPQV